MKYTRFARLGILALVVAMELSIATALADTIRIGDANVTETAKAFGWIDVDWIHKLTIHNKSDLFYITRVEKIVPGYDTGDVDPHGKWGWIVDKEDIDTNGDGKNDSTKITWWGGSIEGASKSVTFTFDTERKKLGFDKNKVTIKTARGPLDPGPTYKGDVAVQEEKKKQGKKTTATGESKGGSVSYNTSNSLLSFNNDYIVSTGFPGDPVIGSAVNLPNFEWVGLNPEGDEALFGIATDEYLTIHEGANIFLRANMAFLTYVISDNLFYGSLFDFSLAGVDPTSPFYDPSLPDIDSPFLSDLDRILNPNSPDYDPSSTLYFTFLPEQNFWTKTAGFSVSAESQGTDGIDAGQPVPEPCTLFLLGSGLAGIIGFGRKRLFGKA